VRSIDPHRQTPRGTQWPYQGRPSVWNSRRGNQLGGRHVLSPQTAHMEASDRILIPNTLQAGAVHIWTEASSPMGASFRRLAPSLTAGPPAAGWKPAVRLSNTPNLARMGVLAPVFAIPRRRQ